MTIEERTSGGVIVLDVQGRMTIEVLGNLVLADRVRQLLQQGHRQILVNLAGVPYVDTSGLCDLVEAYLATTRREGALKLLHLTPHVRKILAITRLMTVFEAYESEAAAVASFGSSAPA
jgi:anti-sigma B factor antagonist